MIGYSTILVAQPIDIKLFDQMKARNIGPAGMSGRVTSVDVVRSQPEIIYVGTASGGLWKSSSGGTDWKPVFDDQKVASIGAVAIDPLNPSVIWAGTGEGNPRNSQTSGYGIYKSLDGGNTWTCMGLENTKTIHRVIVHPSNSNIVYIAATGSAWGPHPERGVYRTQDGGNTWEKVLYVNELTGCADLVIDPDNPNKLIAAMWEYRRWPWYFQSGGEGSGMFISLDGGNTWQERTHQHGLPEGQLGRMGLAIAPSNPQRVYAWIESQKNALYRSDDGGFNWEMINDKEEIGNRPFYYADIYVDPLNENRVYSIYSLISMSEDGGKSFEVIVPFSQVHPDHHVFYIHPDDPDFIIDGNDGGLAISYDRAKSWRFVENLPLAQFYHINIDNLMPYHVYGGMQDNGSWRGPAYIWREGGIRNAYWEELYFGDGFDVIPDPVFPDRFGYAMSQGGYLGRYDMLTGYNKLIKPVHPEGEQLRFNWNAGIAQDPFDDATIYYGSQYLHKSTDRGENWEMISPDLTTNDPEKQKQYESGGLTFDVTNAENHTTIISISPSPIEKGTIWVGTDDGNVQLTKDGGDTWTNVVTNIPNLPEGSWIAQIQASTYNPSEAFVVANNYRRNDWTPYVYYTQDYGTTWTSLVKEDQVWGYGLSFVQDLEIPELMFLGTEFGLYVSIDAGNHWTQWKHGYPTVSTMDLKIHPRERDLIIGTFGRAAYILDDIIPLRTIADQGISLLNEPLYVFESRGAILAAYQQASGTRFAADAHFAGENIPFGALITFVLTPMPSDSTQDEKDLKKVTVNIYDEDDALIRTLIYPPDSGINRIYWELDRKGIRYPDTPEPEEEEDEPSGIPVLPGLYTAEIAYGDYKDSTSIEVFQDPRLNISSESMKAIQEMQLDFIDKVSLVTEAMDQFRNANKSLDLILAQLPENKESQELKDECNWMKDTISHFMEMVTGDTGLQGIVSNPDALMTKINNTSSYLIYGTREAPSSTQEQSMDMLEDAIEAYLDVVNDFFAQDWKDFKKKVEKASLSPFKTSFKPLSFE